MISSLECHFPWAGSRLRSLSHSQRLSHVPSLVRTILSARGRSKPTVRDHASVLALSRSLLTHHIHITQHMMERKRIILSIIAILASLTLYTSIFRSMPRVIVVGSGLAGLSAAHAALAHGASVHVLDSAPQAGGNSIKASSGINGAGTEAQAALGVKDSPKAFYDDTLRSAGEYSPERAELISILANGSADAVSWLSSLGVDLGVVAQLGGHSVPRTHRGHGRPPGVSIIMALLDNLKATPGFRITQNARVTALIHDGAVRGVRYTLHGIEHTLYGAVVFATGGFAGDRGMLERYYPPAGGVASTNDAKPGAHGVLIAIGAELVDMGHIQIHPTGFIDPADPFARTKILAGEMLRGEGGILLHHGRFVNELATRAAITEAIMRLDKDDQDITLLLDESTAAAAASHVAFYVSRGLLQRGKLRSLPYEIQVAVDAYAQNVATHQADSLGRPTYGHWTLLPGTDAEVYVGHITPVVHFTMGGVAIDTSARVLRRDDSSLIPIPGLWAAGEITGGIHGLNRLAGSSLLECVVFGRLAGEGAAKSVA